MSIPEAQVQGNGQFIEFPNQQIEYPYTSANGMTDSNGNWKYCWNSDPTKGLQECLNWCLSTPGCAGVTQDWYNDEDFYFPVTTTSSSEILCSNGISFWELDTAC